MSFSKTYNYLAILLLIVITQITFAQEVVFEDVITKDSFEKKRGPNAKHFWMVYLNNSVLVKDNNDYYRLNYLKSNIKGVGLRYKNKLTDKLSCGIDGGFKLYNLFSDQSIGNKFTMLPAVPYDNERLFINYLGVAPYLRYNFRKTGDHIGWFIDLSPIINFKLNSVHQYTINKKKERSKFDFFEPLFFNIETRVGCSHIALVMNFRLSDIVIRGTTQLPDFPIWDIGLQLGIY